MSGPRVCPDHLPGRMHDAVRYSPMYRPASLAVTALIAAGYAVVAGWRILARKARP